MNCHFLEEHIQSILTLRQVLVCASLAHVPGGVGSHTQFIKSRTRLQFGARSSAYILICWPSERNERGLLLSVNDANVCVQH